MNRFFAVITVVIILFVLSFTEVSAQTFRCGDRIRLTHVSTGANLHSHPINYSHPNSSNQQQITAYQGNDTNDLWVIQDCAGNQIRSGGEIRLQHVATGMYLHSHQGIPAPITRDQQEVTGWVGKDENDLWRVEVEGGGSWNVGRRIRLVHVATSAALHSHNIPGGLLSEKQQEVTGYSGRDLNDFWTAGYARDGVGGNNTNGTIDGDLTFIGSVQRADVWSKASFSNNGRIDYDLTMKNRDQYVGSCMVPYFLLADSQGNIFKTFGGDQICVDGRMGNNSRPDREDRFKYSISRDENATLGSVGVIFTPGGKISTDLLRGNINAINNILQFCPECVRSFVNSRGYRRF